MIDTARLWDNGVVQATISLQRCHKVSSVLATGENLRIICVEEHLGDRDLLQAGQLKRESDAPYFTEVGAYFEGSPDDGDDKRPMEIDFETSSRLSTDVGAGRIAAMDKHGIDMQILSYSNPTQYTPADQVIELARSANDKLAEAVLANPSRFAGFATLPWQHPKAAADELERTVRELGLVGTLLLGRPGEMFLDDPRFDPILEKLDELRVPIYMHPGYPLPQVQQPYYGGLNKHVSARLSLFGWGWHNEAGVHLLRVLLSGKFDQYQNLRVISGHWGEMVPFYLQRLDDSIPQKVTQLSRSITETFKQHVYVTPSGMLNLPHFQFIHTILGADRLLYAVDYPYLTLAGARRFLETLPISEAEKERIAHGNAEELFRLV